MRDGVPDELSLIPQYLYYLRKNSALKTMVSSLDEMAFFKLIVYRENVENCLVIVQPQIIEYSLENEEPIPVLPDLDCMKKEVVLLADTFF